MLFGRLAADIEQAEILIDLFEIIPGQGKRSVSKSAGSQQGCLDDPPDTAVAVPKRMIIHTMSRWQGEPAAHACRPFDRQRDGFVMGEGAACFVVESYEHAAQRGARIYAELAGYSLVSESHHMTIPRPDGEPLRRAMRMALDDARTNASEVDYVNAHASSTPQNDVNEAAQIAAVFGPDAPPVSGTKAFTGHALGAAGAMECAICLLAMEHGWLPPTLHFESTDCAPLDYLPNHGRETRVNTILTNSFGFGGVDSCLVLQRV